jgi:hypothetical protein
MGDILEAGASEEAHALEARGCELRVEPPDWHKYRHE